VVDEREVESLAEALYSASKAWLTGHRNFIRPKWSYLREDIKERTRDQARVILAEADE
jgi:hypothetical protein